MAKAKPNAKIDYQKLSSNLDGVIAKLQDEQTSIDESLDLYEQALKLVGDLNNYLLSAENRLSVIAKKVSGEK